MYESRYEYPLARFVCKCDECGTNLVEGDEVYKIKELTICEDCIDKFKEELEVE